jgi:hypothetical protein
MCETEGKRGKVLRESTFALIPAVINSPSISARLYEALRAAAIPLIIGDIPLPYHEVCRLFNNKNRGFTWLNITQKKYQLKLTPKSYELNLFNSYKSFYRF